MALILGFGAAALLAFWSLWFLDRAALAASTDPVYLGFENTFPVPDTVIAVLMLASAVLLWQRQAVALPLMTVAGGMLLMLSALDVVFFVQHDLYSASVDGWGQIIVNCLTIAGGVLFPAWAWMQRKVFICEEAG